MSRSERILRHLRASNSPVESQFDEHFDIRIREFCGDAAMLFFDLDKVIFAKKRNPLTRSYFSGSSTVVVEHQVSHWSFRDLEKGILVRIMWGC